jgi:hypothetical protein
MMVEPASVPTPTLQGDKRYNITLKNLHAPRPELFLRVGAESRHENHCGVGESAENGQHEPAHNDGVGHLQQHLGAVADELCAAAEDESVGDHEHHVADYSLGARE